MREATFVMAPDHSKTLVPLQIADKKGIRRPASREQIKTRGVSSTELEKTELETHFRPVDFNNTGVRESVIKHYLFVILQDPELLSVSYVAVLGADGGKIRYHLENEMERQQLNFTGTIEVTKPEFGFDGINSSDNLVKDLELVTITRSNQ